MLRDPVFLTVGTDNAGAADIDQRLVYVGREEGKLLAMRQLVQEGLRPPVLVFLQSKDRAKVSLFYIRSYPLGRGRRSCEAQSRPLMPSKVCACTQSSRKNNAVSDGACGVSCSLVSRSPIFIPQLSRLKNLLRFCVRRTRMSDTSTRKVCASDITSL